MPARLAAHCVYNHSTCGHQAYKRLQLLRHVVWRQQPAMPVAAMIAVVACDSTCVHAQILPSHMGHALAVYSGCTVRPASSVSLSCSAEARNTYDLVIC
jgi:hypothetical protein